MWITAQRNDRDGWMASLTRWTWVWASSRSWWWIGKPGVLQSTRLQRVGHNSETELLLRNICQNNYLKLPKPQDTIYDSLVWSVVENAIWRVYFLWWADAVIKWRLHKVYQILRLTFSSVQFSHLVVSDSLWPRESQQARLPCPSPTPGACSNSCPLSQWCHPTISSCLPRFLLPSIFPSIRVFSNESVLRIRRPKYWSSSFSIDPSNEYSGLIFLTCWSSL